MGWQQWKKCDKCGSSNIIAGCDENLKATNTCAECGSKDVSWGVKWKYGDDAESDRWYNSLIERESNG